MPDAPGAETPQDPIRTDLIGVWRGRNEQSRIAQRVELLPGRRGEVRVRCEHGLDGVGPVTLERQDALGDEPSERIVLGR